MRHCSTSTFARTLAVVGAHEPSVVIGTPIKAWQVKGMASLVVAATLKNG